jgi:hypothetical protein
LYGNAHDEILYLWGAGDNGFYGNIFLVARVPVTRLRALFQLHTQKKTGKIIVYNFLSYQRRAHRLPLEAR